MHWKMYLWNICILICGNICILIYKWNGALNAVHKALANCHCFQPKAFRNQVTLNITGQDPFYKICSYVYGIFIEILLLRLSLGNISSIDNVPDRDTRRHLLDIRVHSTFAGFLKLHFIKV